MKSLTSVLGWALLVAVLAVPSFLFYNWWAKSRQQAVAEMPQETAQNIFPAQERSAPAPQPQAAPQQPAAQPAAKEQAPAAQPKPQPLPAPAVKPPQEPSASAQAPAPVQAPAQPAVAASSAPAVQQSSAAAQGGQEQKTASYYKPRTDRDPTLSPDDYQRIKDAEAARQEAERQARWAERNRPKAPDITSRLQLQGIVGNAAIINGEMYAVGQSVYGAKIVKVGANYVIVEHKGKKFRKVLQ